MGRADDPPAPRRAAVTGAAGFIGHHLIRFLRRRGYWVRGVDRADPRYAPSEAHDHRIADLRNADQAHAALEDVDEVYALAADMGGMGYISRRHARILHDNLLIDAHTLEAARHQRVRRLLYASSACVYPEARQAEVGAAPLAEDEAYPAQPQDAYGWAKLTGERLCLHYRLEHGLETRVARLHNVYGPEGAWEGGREKAPAALCRKVATARLLGEEEIEVWGDGRQVRTFCYIDDCVEGLHRLMRSSWPEPVNLGSTRRVTVDELAHLVARVAGVALRLRHAPGPQGVRDRSPDTSLVRRVLGWEAETPLETGLAWTYRWIEERVRGAEPASAPAVP